MPCVLKKPGLRRSSADYERWSSVRCRPVAACRHSQNPPFRLRLADARRTTKLGGFARRSLPRHRQPDLAAERSEARIVLVAQDERVVEEVHDARISVAQGPIEPRESL